MALADAHSLACDMAIQHTEITAYSLVASLQSSPDLNQHRVQDPVERPLAQARWSSRGWQSRRDTNRHQDVLVQQAYAHLVPS